jgi:hypothetical protein
VDAGGQVPHSAVRCPLQESGPLKIPHSTPALRQKSPSGGGTHPASGAEGVAHDAGEAHWRPGQTKEPLQERHPCASEVQTIISPALHWVSPAKGQVLEQVQTRLEQTSAVPHL